MGVLAGMAHGLGTEFQRARVVGGTQSQQEVEVKEVVCSVGAHIHTWLDLTQFSPLPWSDAIHRQVKKRRKTGSYLCSFRLKV